MRSQEAVGSSILSRSQTSMAVLGLAVLGSHYYNTFFTLFSAIFGLATADMVRGKVFTVIAGDSWNTIMYRTMENTNAVSSLFFVALIVLGEVGGRNEPKPQV